jgi:peptidoglycan/xylan/chitin deacetylase (PgdA/CDA1 family)
MQRAASEGHIVANHQWQHVQASTAQLRVWAPRQRNLIDQVIGGAQHPYYFRYPYGSGTSAKEAVLRANNYPDGGVGWHVDTLDWCFGAGNGTCTRAAVKQANRSKFVQHVIDDVVARRGSGVVLFHDVQRITANNLQTIIRVLKQRGYSFGQLPKTGHGFGGPGR